MSDIRVEVDLGARTHAGRVRTNNEDHFLVSRFQRTMTTVLTNLPDGIVPAEHIDTAWGLLVADGMGGRAAGEVASQTAIGTLVGMALQTPDWIMSLDESRVGEVLERMKQRFEHLSGALAERAKVDPTLAGMGTTMTLVLTLAAEAIVVHIGDSRAYLRRADTLHRLTHDQTMAQSLADAGAITPEELKRHPLRHMLTGAITTKMGKAPIELQHAHLEDGDQILLCSDGLTDMVPDGSIREILRGSGSSDEICGALVEKALDAGGKDNVTVVLARYRIGA